MNYDLTNPNVRGFLQKQRFNLKLDYALITRNIKGFPTKIKI